MSDRPLSERVGALEREIAKIHRVNAPRYSGDPFESRLPCCCPVCKALRAATNEEGGEDG